MTTTAIGILLVLLVLLVAIVVRALSSADGLAYRSAQAVWCRVWSLTDFRKSGVRHASLAAIADMGKDSPLEGLARRFAPAVSGWFSALPSDKHGYHDYLRLYDVLLAPYRERAGVRVLEVGVHKGGSLALWREYFAADATIVGLDVSWAVQRFPKDPGITVVIADSRDRAAVAKVLGARRFDVIIDDGLHTPDAQRQTYECLRPFLEPHGVYIIEDVFAFDAAAFPTAGETIDIYPDRSGQYLVVLRPPECEAGEPEGALGSSMVPVPTP